MILVDGLAARKRTRTSGDSRLVTQKKVLFQAVLEDFPKIPAEIRCVGSRTKCQKQRWTKVCKSTKAVLVLQQHCVPRAKAILQFVMHTRKK